MASLDELQGSGRTGNTVRRNGPVVEKVYDPVYAPMGALRELAILGRVGDLPVPRVRAGTRPDALRLEYVEGLLASEAIEAGLASSVLRAMGEALRAIHAVPTKRFGAWKDEDVFCHGDFAPYNLIVSEDGAHVRAILDWEAGCVRPAATDLGWCVMQCRRLFPRYEYAVPQLFAGYGHSFDPMALDEAAQRYARSLSRGGGAHAASPTINFRVASFGERREGAAFIAAVSRAAGAPFRAGPYDPPAEVWAALDHAGLRALLNEPAALVAESAFGLKATQVIRDLPPEARLAFLATHIAPPGIDDILAIL